MSIVSALRELNHEQRHTVLASFLGWTLDAFDYFMFTRSEERRVGKECSS